MRRNKAIFKALSVARIRFLTVRLARRNFPLFVFAQMCVKPRKSKVSGLPFKPRSALRGAANCPKEMRRVLSGCNSSSKRRNRSRSSS